MHGLIRTAGSFAGCATAPATLAMSVLMSILMTACTQGAGSATPAHPWKIADFEYLSDGSRCCTGPLGPAMGILAANHLAMPGNSLKLAAGCRSQPGGTEFGAVVELRVRDSEGRLESFEALELVTTGTCEDADIAWGVAAFRAAGQAAGIWRVTVATDGELCRLIKDDLTARAIRMRALEEAAVRKKCPSEVERLATSSDEELALRAVGSLGRIGAAESIRTLGRLTLSRYPGMPWAATHAIADIGGPDAARALDIVAGQADTIELRVEAEKLADRIRNTY